MNDEFKTFAEDLRKHINTMTEDGNLFVVDAGKDDLWDMYLNSFPAGTNPIFRERTTHDCSACRQFIKAFGNVVSIEDGEVTTIWDFPTHGEYALVATALDAYVKSRPIEGVFVSDTTKIGTEQNHEMTVARVTPATVVARKGTNNED